MRITVRLCNFLTLLMLFGFGFQGAINCQYIDHCDLRFIDHLVNRSDYTEAIFLIESEECKTCKSRDSINYYLGWSLYSSRQLLKSAEALSHVSQSSTFYNKSQFFAAYDYAHIGYLNEAEKVLNHINPLTTKLSSLKKLEVAGIRLIQKDFQGFRNTVMDIDSNLFELSESYIYLKSLEKQMINHKSKSPLVGGLLSAVIPGTGKLYANKKGAAVSSFISTVGLGAVTFENYRKRGINDIRTIAFGSVFLVSYISGIYGSVAAVKLFNIEYDENITNTILFNIHIPLRNVFNK